MKKMIKSLIAAIGVALMMTGSAFAGTTVTTEAFGDNTVFDGTTYYATLQTAVEAVCGTAGATLYCKPGADVGSLQHAPVTATLTIYGNGAYVSGGENRDFDIGNTDPSLGKDVTADMTLTVKDLAGCGAWGTKATEHTVNLVFENCANMGKVWLNGTTGTLNITMTDCAFEGVIKEALYSNADGAITLNNVDFSNLTKAVNLNHKATGTQTVTIDGCDFVNCGANVAADEIPVRVLSSVKGGKSTLTVSGCTFSGTPEGGADVLLDYGVGVTEAAISGTAANVKPENKDGNAEMVAVVSGTPYEYSNVLPVAQIGTTIYKTLAAAVEAAQNGDTIVLIEDAELAETVTIPEGKTLTIDLNGKSISMEESIVTTAYALNNLGTLTLKDSVGTGSVNARGIYNGYGNGADNVATAKIIIQSGTYNAKGTNGGAAIFNYGTAEINGGSFTSIGGYSLNNQAGSSMTIADGVTANNGIYCSNAKVTVNGGNISGNRSGCHVVYAWNAELTINGGTFYNNNSGNATIMSAGTTKCTITGGTFGIKDGRVEGNGNTWTSCLTDTANTATMTVTGGTFNGGFRVQAGTTMTIEGGSFNDVGGSGYGIYGTASVEGGTFTDAMAKTFAANNLAAGYTLGENGAVVAPVAKIGEVKYASLSGAIAAAKSGDTVTLLGDCGITTGIILNKNITIDGGNFTLTAVSGDGSLAQMVKIESAATIKNIALAVNHKYDYGIQMNDPASDLTLENVTILYAGKAEGHKNGELLFGASVFLQQGNLLVKGKFTAFSGGETAGTFPFTGILYWPAGDIAPTFRFDTGATASISDPTGATSDSDLLLVGAPGILSVGEADLMLSAFNIPAGFAPYTLKLDCPIVQGVGGGFTGASPLAWNTIIDYGKKILTVVNESTTETQVEVGILDDVEIPEVFVYEDANFSINGNGKVLSGTIDFTDNVGTISNVKLTSDMTFVMTNVTEGCVKLGEDVIITAPVKVIPPDNFGRGKDSATLIEFAEGSGLSLEDFEIDTSTVQLPEGSQIVQDGNKIIVKLPIAQVGNRKFATLAEAFEAANDGDTVRVLYSFNTNETIVINKAVTFDFSGDVITNTASGAAIQVTAEGVKFVGGELVAKGDGIKVAEGGSSVIECGVYEVTGDALDGAVTVSGGTFNKAANVINAFKSDDCEAVDNGDGWCTVMDYVAQFGEKKYVSLQDAIDAAAATNPTVENPATVTLLGNVAGSVTLPDNVIIGANGYTVQSVVDSVGHIVELHGGAYQAGKHPEQPPIRSIKIVGDKVQLSFVPRKVLAWVKVLSTTDLSAATWTSEEVDVTGAAVGKEFTATVDKPDGNSAFFKIEFAYRNE